jgi:predicted DNA-binding protein (MmcQ/YjbR family)
MPKPSKSNSAKSVPVKSDPVLAAVRKVCLSLPDTVETPTWGKPHFRVQTKIFCGCGEEDGRASIGFKLEREHAAALVAADPRFRPAPYVGHKGWVSVDASGPAKSAGKLLDELAPLILESYRLIAPKRSLAKLAGESPRAAAATQPAKKASAAKGRASRRAR